MALDGSRPAVMTPESSNPFHGTTPSPLKSRELEVDLEQVLLLLQFALDVKACAFEDLGRTKS